MKKLFYGLVFTLLFVINVNGVDALICNYEVPSLEMSFDITIPEYNGPSIYFSNLKYNNLNAATPLTKAEKEANYEELVKNDIQSNGDRYLNFLSINPYVTTEDGATFNISVWNTQEKINVPLALGLINYSSGTCPDVHLNIKYYDDDTRPYFQISTEYNQKEGFFQEGDDLSTAIVTTNLSKQNSKTVVCSNKDMNFVISDGMEYDDDYYLIGKNKKGTFSFYTDKSYSITIGDYNIIGKDLSEKATLLVHRDNNQEDYYEFQIKQSLQTIINEVISKKNCSLLPEIGAYYWEITAASGSKIERGYNIDTLANVRSYLADNVNAKSDSNKMQRLYAELYTPLDKVYKMPKYTKMYDSVFDYNLSATKTEFTLRSLAGTDLVKEYSDKACATKYLKKYPEGCLTLAVKHIQEYCSKLENDEECNKFYEFRDKYLNNFTSLGTTDLQNFNCGSFSNDFIEKLQFFLNILKIAGPIVAIGLGIVDFGKAVISGDADKEMKNASKKFITRIIAAVLLFLVPFLLAFILDVTIGNKDGYDSDNPFCNVVDWEKE